MGRRLILMLTLFVVLGGLLGSLAMAQWTVLRGGNLILKIDGAATPNVLPRDRLAPISFRGRGEIGTADDTHPPAIREFVLDIERGGAIDPVGLPVCAASQLEARDTKGAKRACGRAIVGTGVGSGVVSFPEQRPIPVTTPLTLFNGGRRGGATTVLLHAFITVPVPAAIVTRIELQTIPRGHYGIRVVGEVPVIAGGSGSATAFDFKFGRRFAHGGRPKSYVLGSCPDGAVDFKVVRAVFKDEIGHVGDVDLSGSWILPCVTRE
jgi:hypothetical protein